MNNVTGITRQGLKNEFIIPAIDLINGKVVRLTQGDYSKEKIYYNDPLDAARMLEDAGLVRLHLVDLDGAKAGKVQQLKMLERLTGNTGLKIDFGGGVAALEDVQHILDAGASMVTIGSLAVKKPELLREWVDSFGSDKFFIGADVLEEKIKISGWLQDGGINVYNFLTNMIEMNLNHFFCTDIKKDGAMQGPSVDLYMKIIEQFPGIQLVASGGVSTIEDVIQLQEIGCSGAIIGKAIYEKTISLQELKNINAS